MSLLIQMYCTVQVALHQELKIKNHISISVLGRKEDDVFSSLIIFLSYQIDNYPVCLSRLVG